MGFEGFTISGFECRVWCQARVCGESAAARGLQLCVGGANECGLNGLLAQFVSVCSRRLEWCCPGMKGWRI